MIEEILVELGKGSIGLMFLLIIAAVATMIDRLFDKRKDEDP